MPPNNGRLVAVGGRGARRPKKLRARSLALIRCTRSLIHTLTHRGSALWPSRDEGASTTTINTRAQRKYLCVALAGGRRARAILHRRRRRTNESPRGAARGDYRLKTRKKDKHTRSLAFYYTPIEPPRFACQRDAPPRVPCLSFPGVGWREGRKRRGANFEFADENLTVK
jgi:hypothetical protein